MCVLVLYTLKERDPFGLLVINVSSMAMELLFSCSIVDCAVDVPSPVTRRSME